MDTTTASRLDAIEVRLNALEDRTSSLFLDITKIIEGWGRLFVDVTSMAGRQVRIEQKLDHILALLEKPK